MTTFNTARAYVSLAMVLIGLVVMMTGRNNLVIGSTITAAGAVIGC